MTLIDGEQPMVEVQENTFGVLSRLNNYLERQNLIIEVVLYEDKEAIISYSNKRKGTDKQLVILSSAGFSKTAGEQIYFTVTEEELKTILELYKTYEFSNKFVILSNNQNYGSMRNYVDTGLLSMDEMFDAILS